MMRPHRLLVVAALALLLISPVSADDSYDDDHHTPPEDEQQLEFTTGMVGARINDEAFRVAEYDLAEPSPMLGLMWATSPYGPTQFRLDLTRFNHEHFEGSAGLDFKRIIQLELDTDGLLHRLDHDPLTNLQAVSDVKVVRSTDYEPGVDYDVRHAVYDGTVGFHPTGSDVVDFRIGVRREERQGTRQHLNVSHCTSCHVTAQGREIDQATTDLTAGVHVAAGRFDVDYQLMSRSFEENAGTITAPYERAYHPGLPNGPGAGILTPFNDRLWFQDGSYPVNRVPDVDKLQHTLKFRVGLPHRGELDMTVVNSTTENTGTSLQYDFTGYRGRWVFRAGDDFKLDVYAQRDEIDNDPVDIDLLDLNGLTGAPVTAYGGFATPITYEAWRQAVDDPLINFTTYVRESSLDRTDDRLGVDAAWRFGRRSKLRVGYRYRAIDRDNVILADGTGETTEHRLTANHALRLARRLRWFSTLTLRSVDNPYVADDSGRRMFAGYTVPGDPMSGVLGVAASPKAPTSLQYYQLHMLRTADLSNAPTDELKLRSNVTWSPSAKVALSGNARYRDADNSELDGSDWDTRQVGVGVNLWVAPSPGFHYTLGYDRVLEETDAVAYIPLMDG